MSDFSEKLAQEIKNTNKPLRYLAEASGLQLDYISKMSRGKRIPQDEEKLKRLLDAMECVTQARETLLQLYRQERMGKTQWSCMKELIQIIEQDVSENVMDRQSFPKKEGKEEAVLSREEVFCFLQSMLTGNEKKRLCIWTAAVKQESMERLMQMISGMACGSIDHLFPMWQNRDDENTLVNLKRLRVIKPAVLNDNYHPSFYYLKNEEENSCGLFPNWFLSEDAALGVNDAMDCGIVLRRKGQIEALKAEFLEKFRMAKPLVNRSDISEYMDKVNLMMDTGYVTRNYYLEQSPCLLHLIPVSLLKEHILIGGEDGGVN